MKSFADIRTLYENASQRSIDYLSSIYDDNELLYNTIDSLFMNHIKESQMRDKNILLKPNWVRENIQQLDKICLCTNEKLIIETVRAILKYKPKSIIIGDAPIQGCNWNLLLSKSFYNEINKLALSYSIPIEIKDYRRTKIDRKNNRLQEEMQPLDEYIIFDTSIKSYLEPISSDYKKFRITSYDPEKLIQNHRQGIHRYCITKDLFRCDLVITMPKIKTHQKVGITNALKILVGLNGDKNFLPHHRVGAIEKGGDCYPGYSPLRSMSEALIDKANRNRHRRSYSLYKLLSSLLWKLSFPKEEQTMSAAWSGNDTAWRMVLDINLIALYGKGDGSLSNEQQRTIYSLCDGIVGGQGDGPLNPSPLPLGIIAFSNDSYLIDFIVGKIFRLDIEKIAILREALKYINTYDIYLNNDKIDLEDINSLSLDVELPPGWKDYVRR